MRKYLYLSAAALAFASCSSDEFVGNDPGTEVKNTGATIAFGSEALNATRAELKGSLAAEKLNNNFIVYGFKTNGAETTDGTKSNDEKVFDTYNVNFVAGTANTTESNTADWEYVGLNAHETSSITGLQSIKYWDYAANGYVFSAVSGTGIIATKAETAVTGTEYSMTGKALTVNGTATQYDKGWKVVLPAGGSLSDLYASDRLPITKPTSPDNYGQVDLTFRALGTKIRFAMYETVPGYEIHVDKFYYDDAAWKNTETNFAINGAFKTANATSETPLYVIYYDASTSIENRPKVSYNDGDVTTGNWYIFGANIQAKEAIGTTSVEATYDQSDKSYTMILPFESATNDLLLYVDYTLTSTDGSGETIKVKHASAKVPANFNQWKPNFAYTYIFKISDNTGGTTGDPGDPDDPTSTPTDPEKLYPITFDAVVITDETDVQETITSVSNPSITTYQKGVVVTENDEYVAGDDIYFEDGNADVSGYKVYEVNNYGAETTTEEVVANWKNNFCVLTEVTVTRPTAADEEFIPLSDGTYIKKSPTQAAKFSPVAGKTYAIANDDAASATQWKVVKVAGGPASVTTALSATTGTITAEDGVATVALTQNYVAAIGAKKTFQVKKGGDVVTTQFNITDAATAGSYDLQFTDEAILSGAAKNASAGTYTVNMLDEEGSVLATVDFTVTLDYVLDAASINIEAGNTIGDNTILKIASNATENAVIVNDNKGITITDNTDGTYTVVADVTVKNGVYTATIAGESLTINVANYQFTAASYVYNMNTAGALIETGKVTLQTYEDSPAAATGVAAGDITITLGGSASDDITLTGDNGVYTVGLKTAGAGNGTYTLTKANTAAEATVVVNKYTMNNVSIKKATGIETLTVQANGKTINASKSNLVITDGSSNDVTSSFTVSTNGSTLILSSVKSTLTAGTYTATYYLEVGHINAIATSTITVTE